MFRTLFYFTVITLSTQSAFANSPILEAYYKFNLGGQHSGYVVQRYTIDDSKKEMTSTYYAYVKTPTGSTTESLVSKSDLNFEPISYQYSAIVDGKAKFVDATFKDKQMKAKMVDSGKTQTVILKVPKNGFLSSFLNYVLLKNGLMINKNYDYLALAEESPACFKDDRSCQPKDTGFIKGTAAIKSEQKYKDADSFRINFNFKSIDFVGIVGSAGETLASISPLQSADTEIVKSRAEAIGKFPFNEKHIRMLFGNIPEGTKNPLFKNAPAAPATAAVAPSAAAAQSKIETNSMPAKKFDASGVEIVPRAKDSPNSLPEKTNSNTNENTEAQENK